jgi:hypothetical protein
MVRSAQSLAQLREDRQAAAEEQAKQRQREAERGSSAKGKKSKR